MFQTFYLDPISIYTFVTEKKTSGNPEPFITKSPLEYIQSGEFANVPWILGAVEDEGLLKAEGKLRFHHLRKKRN